MKSVTGPVGLAVVGARYWGRTSSGNATAKQQLGWKPEVDLRTGLTTLVDWWCSQQVAHDALVDAFSNKG